MPNESHPVQRNTVGGWAKAFHRASQSAMESVLRHHDLGPTQWSVLYHLTHDGPTTQRDLTRTLRVERATLSGVVASLVRKGLVEQAHDAADQRRRLLRLTSSGAALWHVLPDPIALIAGVAFADADSADLATAMKVLEAATRRLIDYPWEGRTS